MGGRGPHLGLVVTKGGLLGYSIESRDIITGSNTRGVFSVHPNIPTLAAGASTTLSWTMFWHTDWDDFFAQCATLSTQFVHVKSSALTVYSTKDVVQINVIGPAVDRFTTVNGVAVTSYMNETYSNSSAYGVSVTGLKVGEHIIPIVTSAGNTSIIINSIQAYNTTIATRVSFIAANQQIDTALNSTLAGALVVYDNQMNGIVTFDTASDRNAGRERMGMGVLLARWLKNHPDSTGKIQAALTNYYVYVCTQLQTSNGYVNQAPGNTGQRLYNWPWVMQLHLEVAQLNLMLSDSLSSQTPLQRFMATVENYYANGGISYYAIGLPVFDGLRYLRTAGNATAYNRALTLFTGHGAHFASIGTAYPSSEVNFEQSIVAPSAIFLLELYRYTNSSSWLAAAKPHFARLELFGGRQPDYHLYDVAIRHWDGYWFRKDRMWGDTFPHYWSSLTAVAFHHYARAIGGIEGEGYEARADGILRGNLKLFGSDGKASCAFIFPVSVNGRVGHYADAYANDQDWALVHLLQIKEE